MTILSRAISCTLESLYKADLEPVTVAIVDSGVDATHPDLKGRVIRSWKVVNGADGPSVIANETLHNNDDYGHGTGVAGVVAAVAPNARLLDIRVLDEKKQSSGEALLCGIQHAIDQGAKIINLSLACRQAYANQLHDLNELAYRNNQVVVAAKRNMAIYDLGQPAELSSSISVDIHSGTALGGLGYLGGVIEFGAHGENVKVLAPGGGYTVTTGTSFATPLVSGICALLLGAFPELRVFEIKALLKHFSG